MKSKKNRKNKKVFWLFKLFDLKMIVFDIAKILVAIPTLLFYRMKRYYINGKRQKKLLRGTFIVASNHFSYVDPVTIMTAFWQRRIGFICKKELFVKKPISMMLKSFGVVPIDAENVSINVLKKKLNQLKYGHLISIFPEGHLELNNKIDEFKEGTVLVAILGNVPIVPMYIYKRTKWYKRQVVMIGEKFYPQDYITSNTPTFEEIQTITKMLYEKELELEQKCLEKLGVTK